MLAGPVFDVGGCAVLTKYIVISKCPLLVLGILADAGDGPRWCCTFSLVLGMCLTGAVHRSTGWLQFTCFLFLGSDIFRKVLG